jgi:osmoprotectant transport system permease protein
MSGRWVPALALLAAFALGVLAQRGGLVDQIAKYRGDIAFLTQQHMKLVAISGGLAIAIGVPLGLWLSRPRMRRAAESIMQALNLGSTIPTLAVLALSMSLLGIGVVPAIFGLWVASLLPIVRNTYAGVLSVPAHYIEAAMEWECDRCRSSRASRCRTRCTSCSPGSGRRSRSTSARRRSRS